MPISPYWTGIDELTAPPRRVPPVPLRPDEEMEEVPPPPPPAPRVAPSAAPANPERDQMRAFLRKRYPDQFQQALGEFEGANVTPEQAAASRERAADYGFLGALSQASAGIGNYGGEMSKTTVPEYMKGIQDREAKALATRGALADQAFGRMDASVKGMDALDAAEYEASKRPLEEQKLRNTLRGQEMDLSEAESAQKFESDKRNPQSEISKTMREMTRARWAKAFPGTPFPENISAAALEKYIGTVDKEYGAVMEREWKAQESEARRRENDLDRASRERIAGMGVAARAAGADGKATDKVYGAEDSLRKEFNSRDEVKKYATIKQSFAQMEAAAAVPEEDIGRASADIAMVYNFMRMQDPTSTVREGEFATAANAGGVSESVRNMYNRVMEGEKLGPKVRQGFLEQARRDYSQFRNNYEGIRKDYGRLAGERGLAPQNVIGTDSAPEQRPPETTTTPAPSARRVWKPGG